MNSCKDSCTRTMMIHSYSHQVSILLYLQYPITEICIEDSRPLLYSLPACLNGISNCPPLNTSFPLLRNKEKPDHEAATRCSCAHHNWNIDKDQTSLSNNSSTSLIIYITNLSTKAVNIYTIYHSAISNLLLHTSPNRHRHLHPQEAKSSSNSGLTFSRSCLQKHVQSQNNHLPLHPPRSETI